MGWLTSDCCVSEVIQTGGTSKQTRAGLEGVRTISGAKESPQCELQARFNEVAERRGGGWMFGPAALTPISRYVLGLDWNYFPVSFAPTL